MHNFPVRQRRFQPADIYAAPDNPSEQDHGTNPTDVSGHHPTTPDNVPDYTPDEVVHNVANLSPAPPGQRDMVPDGWIPRNAAHELLSQAGIEMDSRRIRHLCARLILESVKVKNEKNQPQYFINPTSLAKFIAENRPTNVSGTSPDQVTIHLDNTPDETAESVANPNPAPSRESEPSPDQPAGHSEAGEWVPKAQLDQALSEIEFLRSEAIDNRQLKRDLKQISTELLETVAQFARPNQTLERPQTTSESRGEPMVYRAVPSNSSSQSDHYPRGGV